MKRSYRVLVCLGFAGAMLGTAFAQKAPTENPPVIEAVDSVVESRDWVQVLAAPTTEWVLHKTADGAHPDGNEQAMVWLMNRARSNPEQEGIYLANTGDSRVQGAISFFGVDLNVMQAEFAAIASRPPAAFDRRIYLGSETHSLDLIARDAQDHNNQFQRVSDAGFSISGANASVFSFSENPVHAHAGFNIDWGGGTPDGMQVGRGHRVGLMSSGSMVLSNVGISMVAESNPGTQVGPLVTSIVYASANTFAPNHYNMFFVGTVWTDLNSNGIYDSGEGMSGVTVMPDSGTFYAVTGDAGGYAIPISIDGSYTLTFSGGDLSVSHTRSVTVSGESVLVPWNPEDSYNPTNIVQLTEPEVSITKTSTGIVIAWEEVAGQDYSIQRLAPQGTVWEDDSRTITRNGSAASASITNQEIEAGWLYRIRSTSSPSASSAAE